MRSALYLTHANICAFPSSLPDCPFLFSSVPFHLSHFERFFRGQLNICVALNGLFADMRMSSSMYEVFNWNSSPDPPLTPAKHKRASLSLPPTTDIFAIDDKSDSDTRRPMIQRAASGESWCFRTCLRVSREFRSCSPRKNEYCRSYCFSFVLAHLLLRGFSVSISLSLSLLFYVLFSTSLNLSFTNISQHSTGMSRSFNTVRA